jgi:hypothetical protein
LRFPPSSDNMHPLFTKKSLGYNHSDANCYALFLKWDDGRLGTCWIPFWISIDWKGQPVDSPPWSKMQRSGWG